jgi:hypothetical protein
MPCARWRSSNYWSQTNRSTTEKRNVVNARWRVLVAFHGWTKRGELRAGFHFTFSFTPCHTGRHFCFTRFSGFCVRNIFLTCVDCIFLTSNAVTTWWVSAHFCIKSGLEFVFILYEWHLLTEKNQFLQHLSSYSYRREHGHSVPVMLRCFLVLQPCGVRWSPPLFMACDTQEIFIMNSCPGTID